jgi:sec-independent protein translocase protein TatC
MKIQRKKPQANQQIKKLNSPLQAKATFYDHVVELRNRGLWIGLFAVISSGVAYTYHDVILKVIMAPLDGQKLIYLTPGGGFSFIFLITMYAGLLATLPVVIYHLHAFIKPALPERAQRSALKIILASTILIVAGVLYGYFVAIPAALKFLMTFAGDAVTPSLTAESYLNFFLAYVAGLAFLSLLPLLLMFAHWTKPLKPSGLLKSERWVILFAFIAAAIITPTPDIVNQAMIAAPVIGIYQLGVIVVLVAILKEKRDRKKDDAKRKETEMLIDVPAIETLFPAPPVSAVALTPVTPPVTLIPDVEYDNTTKQTVATEVASPPPPRKVRSMDGFRRGSSPRNVSRSSVIVRGRAQPPSIDAIISSNPQISQN